MQFNKNPNDWMKLMKKTQRKNERETKVQQRIEAKEQKRIEQEKAKQEKDDKKEEELEFNKKRFEDIADEIRKSKQLCDLDCFKNADKVCKLLVQLEKMESETPYLYDLLKKHKVVNKQKEL